MSVDSDNVDAPAVYPAIDRAMKILSNRLGIFHSDTRVTEDDESEHEDGAENTVDVIEDSIEKLTKTTTDNVLAHEFSDDSERGESDVDQSSVSLERIPIVNINNVDSIALKQQHNHERSGLSGVSILAHRKSQEQEIDRNHVSLTKQAKVLRKALDWCRVWSLKKVAFEGILQHLRCRVAMKTLFHSIISNIYRDSKYGVIFSSHMKTHCRNRFGKVRVSELYSNWRVKRRCLLQWISSMIGPKC